VSGDGGRVRILHASVTRVSSIASIGNLTCVAWLGVTHSLSAVGPRCRQDEGEMKRDVGGEAGFFTLRSRGCHALCDCQGMP
jgi:hypothetical protein